MCNYPDGNLTTHLLADFCVSRHAGYCNLCLWLDLARIKKVIKLLECVLDTTRIRVIIYADGEIQMSK